MRGRSTMFLLAAVLVLGGFIFFVERHQESSDEKRARARLAFDLRGDLISGLKIRRPEYVVDLRRNPGTGIWELQSPRGARANLQVLQQVISRLARLDRGELITPEDIRTRNQTLADYGLAVPRVTLEITSRVRVQRYLVGNPNPLGTSIYVKEEQSQNIMAVSSDLLDILPTDADAFRDRRVLFLPRGEVRSLELQTPARTVRLHRDAAGLWSFAEPVGVAARQDAVETLLSKLEQARIEAFLPDDGNSSAYGLEDTARSVLLSNGGSSLPHRLVLGRPVQMQPEHIYARLDGQEGIFTVSAGVGLLAETEVAALRRREVLQFPTNLVNAVDLVRPGGEQLHLRRTDTGWKMVQPREASLSEARVLQVLQVWAEARVEEFLAEPSTNPAPAEVLFEAEFRGGPSGREVPRRFQVLRREGSSGRVHLRPVGATESWVVVPDGLKFTPLNPLHYRSHEVLRFNPHEVIRISWKHRGNTNTITRVDAASAWTGPSSAAPDQDAISRIVTMAASLRAERLVEQDPPDLAAYGLATPQAEVSFGLKGTGLSNRSLLVGDALASGQVYATIRGQDLVFLLDPALLALLDVLTPNEVQPDAPAVPTLP